MKYTFTAIVLVMAIMTTAVAASPGKQDRFGCHKCLSGCEKYELVKSEYHCHGTESKQSKHIQIAPRIYDGKTYRRVASVIDGDTLFVYMGLGGKKVKVRLLGIDAPEAGYADKAQCYSTQATQKLKALVSNKFVLLQKDKIQKDDKDTYGRLLRYVTLLENNISVNEELVKGGYAKAYPSLTSRVELYKRLENLAKEQKLGMWSECLKEKKTTPAAGDRRFPLKGEKVSG